MQNQTEKPKPVLLKNPRPLIVGRYHKFYKILQNLYPDQKFSDLIRQVPALMRACDVSDQDKIKKYSVIIDVTRDLSGIVQEDPFLTLVKYRPYLGDEILTVELSNALFVRDRHQEDYDLIL